MKYPAIYKSEIGNIYLHANKSTLCHIVDGKCHDWCFLDCAAEQVSDKNITHEYLANTYGEVVSPEHAEFIVELCRVNGIQTIYSSSASEAKSFEIGERHIILYSFVINELNLDSKKQITIPLPPKQIQTATPEEEFEMKQIMKNAGDNLVLGCEQDFKVARRIINELREEANCSDELLSSRDEWPKIGDEVLTTDNNKGILIVSKPDDHNMVVVECKSHDYGKFYRVVRLSDLSKPKTPEEELFDAFWREVGLLMNQSNLNKGIFKAAFINNITKKPQ